MDFLPLDGFYNMSISKLVRYHISTERDAARYIELI
jgi:hypothetical protein